MEKLLSPSMMCADFGALKQELEALEKAGIDLYHLDAMDRKFVPNFGMGLQDIQYICGQGKRPSDVHLMIQDPGDYVELFAGLGERKYLYPSGGGPPSSQDLQKIIDAGARPGIAINQAPL